MKRIILSVALIIVCATTIYLAKGNRPHQENILANVEALTQTETEDGGTCCKQRKAQCRVGSVTLVNKYKLEGDSRPCP